MDVISIANICALAQLWDEWYETKPDGTKQWYRTYGLEVSDNLPAAFPLRIRTDGPCCL